MPVVYDRIRAWSEDSARATSAAAATGSAVAAASARSGGHISWPAERARDQRRREQQSVGARVRDHVGEWVVIVGGAALAALLARGASALGDFLDTARTGYCVGVWYASRRKCCAADACADWNEWHLGPLVFVLLSAIYAAGAALLVDELAARTAMSGISELKAYFAGYAMPGLLGIRQLFVKSAGLALALGSGLYVGREGPLVHIACAAGAALLPVVFREPQWAKLAAGRQATRAMSRTPSQGIIPTIGSSSDPPMPLASPVQSNGPDLRCGTSTLNTLGTQLPTLLVAAPKLSTMSESRRRDIIVAVAAAGVALSFNAPIGGVMFVLEILGPRDKRVLWRGFVAAMVAVLVFEMLSDHNASQLLQYEVSYDRVWHAVELGPFALLGSVCGLAGSALVQANLWLMRRRREAALQPAQGRSVFARALALSPIATAAATAALTAAVAWPNLLSVRKHADLLSALLQECRNQAATGFLCSGSRLSVILALLHNLVQIAVFLPATYGLAIPAGILQPSLLCGALIGRLYGLGAASLFASHPSFLSKAFCPDGKSGGCVTPGVYALVGAAATLTGVTRLTVASVVILFEMTDALTYVVPIMVGVMAAKWTADAASPMGIYDAWLALESLAIPTGRLRKPLPLVVAGDVMKVGSQCAVARVSDSVGQLARLAQTNAVFAFPVLAANDETLLGSIHASRLRETLPLDLNAHYELREYMADDTSVLNVRTPLSTLWWFISKRGLHTCFITDRGKFCGLITLNDLCARIEHDDLGGFPQREADRPRPSLDRFVSDF